MATTSPHSEWTFDPGVDTAAKPSDDPFNRFYRAPLARLFVRGLQRTRITADLLTFVQPLLAAVAGYFLTFADLRHLVLAVLLFEARAILACTAGALARAQQQPAPDRVASWLSLFFLGVGLAWHFHLYPPSGAWSDYLAVHGVLLLALLLLNGSSVRGPSRPATAPARAS
jgi:hypothetical protein